MCDSHRVDQVELGMVDIERLKPGDYVVRTAEEHLWVQYGLMRVVDLTLHCSAPIVGAFFGFPGFPPLKIRTHVICERVDTGERVSIDAVALRYVSPVEALVWRDIYDPQHDEPPV